MGACSLRSMRDISTLLDSSAQYATWILRLRWHARWIELFSKDGSRCKPSCTRRTGVHKSKLSARALLPWLQERGVT